MEIQEIINVFFDELGVGNLTKSLDLRNNVLSKKTIDSIFDSDALVGLIENSQYYLATWFADGENLPEEQSSIDLIDLMEPRSFKEDEGEARLRGHPYYDLVASASGSGYGGHGGYGCPEGVPVDFALLSILAAFGASFGILYTALTLLTKKRKKRGTMESHFDDVVEEWLKDEELKSIDWMSQFMWHGKFLRKSQ